VTGTTKRRGGRREKEYYNKKGGDAHMCREWDFDMSSIDSSSDKDAANIIVNKGLLLPNVGHKCFMEKDGKKKKVQSRTTPKYTTSSDEGSSSEDEDDLLSLFANLNMQQKEKLNELIGAIHEKDELLDSQEEFLNKENKKHVKLKNSYAREIENKKFKFARSMLYSGRRPGIKDGIGFQQGSNVKLNAPKRLSNFVKGKAPMAQDNKGYILYPVGYCWGPASSPKVL
jgi:hypothetical protein